LGAYVEKNKLRLKDDPNLKTDDLHMTIDAHRLVANTIYEKIRG
jgi:lysophospholipase L1-like esterase